MFVRHRVLVHVSVLVLLTVLVSGCGITRAIRPRVKSPVETEEFFSATTRRRRSG